MKLFRNNLKKENHLFYSSTNLNYFLAELKELNGQFTATKLSIDKKTNQIESKMGEVLKETKDMKKHLLQYNFHLRMDTADITHLFPLQNCSDIRGFLKRDDEWPQRKKER